MEATYLGAAALLVRLAAVKLALGLQVVLKRRTLRLRLGLGRLRSVKEGGVLLEERAPVHEHAHVGEELAPLLRVGLERLDNVPQLLGGTIWAPGLQPAIGDGEHRHHRGGNVGRCRRMPCAELGHVDKGFGRKVLPAREGHARVCELLHPEVRQEGHVAGGREVEDDLGVSVALAGQSRHLRVPSGRAAKVLVLDCRSDLLVGSALAAAHNDARGRRERLRSANPYMVVHPDHASNMNDEGWTY